MKKNITVTLRLLEKAKRFEANRRVINLFRIVI